MWRELSKSRFPDLHVELPSAHFIPVRLSSPTFCQSFKVVGCKCEIFFSPVPCAVKSFCSNSIKSPPQIGSRPEFEGHRQPVHPRLIGTQKQLPSSGNRKLFISLYISLSFFINFIMHYYICVIIERYKLYFLHLLTSLDVSWHLLTSLSYVLYSKIRRCRQCRLWPQAWHQGTPPGETKLPENEAPFAKTSSADAPLADQGECPSVPVQRRTIYQRLW